MQIARYGFDCKHAKPCHGPLRLEPAPACQACLIDSARKQHQAFPYHASSCDKGSSIQHPAERRTELRLGVWSVLLSVQYCRLLCQLYAVERQQEESELTVLHLQGPILRPISRLGRNGKHSNLPQNKQMNPNGSKDSRYVYLSIDEASSHIGSIRHTFFR